MNELSHSSEDPASLESLECIDQLCLQFEAAWKTDQAPQIEAFLEQAIPAHRSELLRELLRLELDYRMAAARCRGSVNDRPQLDEYLKRFPNEAEEVRAAFHESPTLNPASVTIVKNSSKEQQITNETDCAKSNAAKQMAGRYQLQSLIGSGAFGEVYRSFDSDLDRTVAIKILQASQLRGEARNRFDQEARLAASLKHHGIVTIFDVGKTDDESPYIVMEYVDGGEITAVAAQHRLSHEKITEIFILLVEAVYYAHTQGLIHRDIKPSNVLLDRDLIPHVVDFGLAIHESAQKLRAREVAGTPHFMSPEQIRGETHRLDGRTDIWALGVTLYELLTQQRPFQGEDLAEVFDEILNRDPKPPRQIDEKIPAELERICLKCLAKRMNDRHLTAADLADDLKQWLFAQGSTAADVAGAAQAAGYVVRPNDAAEVIPKGLRSFDDDDADFFLQLLPGPVDRDGLPSSLRFWRSHIEEQDPDRTFNVGVIYGPSGCGKSSFVKAGLLPRLSTHLRTVYVEATAEDTESRLLHGLRRHLTDFSEDDDLADAIAQLRELGPSRSGKILLVIDQFEQWLHGVHGAQREVLVGGLRHCDGQYVQCLLLVRDDFWMALSRLMRELEIPLVEGKNSLAVDLFDLEHARKVLIKFGRAFGRLPAEFDEMTTEHKKFIAQAVSSIADEDTINPVRLSLLADMVKSRPWEGTTWKQLGGPERIGAVYLEETFATRSAPLEHRQHQKAARRVLEKLLPSEGTDLRGDMRSYDELLDASNYERHGQDFRELLHILDNNLRLITPTDPEGVEREHPSTNSADTAKYYQLTHDFLVPSLRQWLTSHRKQTWQGRAELRLKERSAQWIRLQENRFLPSLGESLSIQLATSSRHWSKIEREMMNHAWRVYGMRTGLTLLATILLVGLVVLMLPKASPPLEIFLNPLASPERRIAALDAIELNDAVLFRLLDALQNEQDPHVFRRAISILRKFVFESDGTSDRRIRVVESLQRILAESDRTADKRQAFALLVELATPQQVTDLISSEFANSVGTPLSRDMLQYVEGLQLSDVDESSRRGLTRWLVGTLDGSQHEMASASASVLNRLSPEDLLHLFMEAFDDDIKVAATRSLVPYTERCGVGRVDEICDFFEQKLSQLASERLDGVIPWTYELEFLTQGLGEVWDRGSKKRHQTLTSVATLLDERDMLEDPEMLDIVLRSFARLYSGNRRSGDEFTRLWNDVHEILDTMPDVFIRLAAAEAVSQVEDLPNEGAFVSTLSDLVKDKQELLNLRESALRSLGAMGARSKRREAGQTWNAIANVISQLLSHTSTEPALRKVALEMFAGVARAEQVRVIFPLLHDEQIAGRGLAVLQTTMLNNASEADAIMRELLRFLIDSHDRVNAVLPFPPEQLLFEFGVQGTDQQHPRAIEVVQRVAPVLAEHAATGESVAERELAGRFLKRLLGDTTPPAITATAPDSLRRAHLASWRDWWQVSRENLQLDDRGRIHVIQ